jgi:hypothetical protein
MQKEYISIFKNFNNFNENYLRNKLDLFNDTLLAGNNVDFDFDYQNQKLIINSNGGGSGEEILTPMKNTILVPNPQPFVINELCFQIPKQYYINAWGCVAMVFNGLTPPANLFNVLINSGFSGYQSLHVKDDNTSSGFPNETPVWFENWYNESFYSNIYQPNTTINPNGVVPYYFKIQAYNYGDDPANIEFAIQTTFDGIYVKSWMTFLRLFKTPIDYP